MIVYRADEQVADPTTLLRHCAALARNLTAGRPDHDDVTELLIDLGVLEAAVADALCPDADSDHPRLAELRAASVAVARLLVASWDGRDVGTTLDLGRIGPLPPEVRLRIAEGYAYYGLYPETYVEAARRFARGVTPGPVVCVGLRSIGTSLSAVVAAALEREGFGVESLTLRPRGHPFDRRPVLAPALAERLCVRSDAWFLIVDEGPGLSGSSFCGTADLLESLGVPASRIVLFPSHLPDPDLFVSDAARARWGRYAKAHTGFEEIRLPRAPFAGSSREISGGAWRSLLGLTEADWPAVQPQHERRKYLVEGADGQPVLHKFSGLGCYGRRALERALDLAEAGFSPPVIGLEGGFLASRFVPGRPLRRADADPDFLGMAARYLGHLGRQFTTGRAAQPEALLEMIRSNVTEGLGEVGLDSLANVERTVGALGEVSAVAVDARLMPHEWLRTADGYLKTDALDHHADHFFPGTADLAWDVAGFGVEFDLGTGAQAEVAEAVGRAIGDRRLPARLPFYRVAYTAARLGYAVMAAGALAGSPDGARMAREAERYRGALATGLKALAP